MALPHEIVADMFGIMHTHERLSARLLKVKQATEKLCKLEEQDNGSPLILPGTRGKIETQPEILLEKIYPKRDAAMDEAKAVYELKLEQAHRTHNAAILHALRTQARLFADKESEEEITLQLLQLPESGVQEEFKLRWEELLAKLEKHGVDVSEINNLDNLLKSTTPWADLKVMWLPIKIPESSVARERRLKVEEHYAQEFGMPAISPRVNLKHIITREIDIREDSTNGIFYVYGNIYTPYRGDPFFLASPLVFTDNVYRCTNPPKDITVFRKIWSVQVFLYRTTYENFKSGAGGELLKLNGLCYFLRTTGKFKGYYTKQKFIMDGHFGRGFMMEWVAESPASTLMTDDPSYWTEV